MLVPYASLPLSQWYTLNDVKSGKVHLILEWVPTVLHSGRLDQVRIVFLFIHTLFKHGLWKFLPDNTVESLPITQAILNTLHHNSGRSCSFSLYSLTRTKLSQLLPFSLST